MQGGKQAMGRFQQWFSEEREKLRKLSPRDRAGYI